MYKLSDSNNLKKLSFLILAISLILVCSMFIEDVSAVEATGTISDAITATPAGGEVSLQERTYSGNGNRDISLSKQDLTFRGMGSTPTIIDAGVVCSDEIKTLYILINSYHNRCWGRLGLSYFVSHYLDQLLP